MPITKLNCPYCGSTLNFGREVAEGTPVDCLICMTQFPASNVESFAAPELAMASQSSVGQDVVVAPPSVHDEWQSPPTLHAEEERSVPDTIELPPAPVMETLHDEPPPVAVVEPDDVPPAIEPIADVVEESSAAIDVELVDTAEIGEPQPAKKKRPKHDVPIAKAYAPPVAQAVTETPPPPKASVPAAAEPEKARPAAARRSADDDSSSMAGTILLGIATCVLLFVLTGGIVFGAWKLSQAARSGSSSDGDATNQLAAKSSKPAANVPPNGKSSTPKANKSGDSGEEEDDDARDKIDEEIKQVLKRKLITQPGGAGIQIDPISSVNSGNSAALTEQQRKINEAIDKGVKYLKRTQHANGTWHHGHPVGYAAIGGLTLLECDVSPKDPAVQRAASYVRANAGNLNHTYQISLAILFLDRLGDSRDRPLIQGMALRLMAGQNEGGGWTYSCPELSPPDMYKLYAFLQSHKQPNLLNPIGMGGMKTQSGIAINPKRDPAPLNDPFAQFDELILAKGIASPGDPNAKPKDKGPGLIPPVGTDPKTTPKKTMPAVKPIAPSSLPANLQNLAIVKNQGVKKGQGKGRFGAGDNSNTQFAMLALWAARRNNVPADQSLLLAYQRFMSSHNADGGWGYHPGGHTTHTMTNVGLLGLAMGHGAAPEIVNFNPKNPRELVVKPALEDPSIRRGLQALARYIGQPVEPGKNPGEMQNLYFLWSVERVAMLYDLKTIGGKDWYGWGSQILVHHQQGAGDWPSVFYHGNSPPLNTCFALLFLRRSNLVQDLTNQMRLTTGIVDTEK